MLAPGMRSYHARTASLSLLPGKSIRYRHHNLRVDGVRYD
jgi:hypothetical protein